MQKSNDSLKYSTMDAPIKVMARIRLFKSLEAEDEAKYMPSYCIIWWVVSLQKIIDEQPFICYRHHLYAFDICMSKSMHVCMRTQTNLIFFVGSKV